MTIDAGRFSALVGQLTDVLLDPGGLQGVLGGLAAMAGVEKGSVVRGVPGKKAIVASVGLSDGAVAAYNGRFHRHDRLLERDCAGPMAFTGRNEEHVWPAYSQSEFLHGWAIPSGCRHIALVTVAEGAERATLTLAAADRGRGFARQVELLGLIAPHFRRTMKVAARLRRLERRGERLLEALDRWRFGAVILDGRGKVRHANAAALEIARQGDGLSLSGRGVRASHPDGNRALAGLIARTLAADPRDPGPDAVVGIARPSLAHPYLVHAFPLGARGSDGWCAEDLEEAAVLLVIVDPALDAPREAERIRLAFGLTPAEAAVAARIVAGQGLPAVAEGIGIKHSTARTHMQRIFAKTGTSRQAELALLLARLGPEFREREKGGSVRAS
ncbi:MAG: helix-turn-helix transcriptional regulator [Amaricoccus sp.]